MGEGGCVRVRFQTRRADRSCMHCSADCVAIIAVMLPWGQFLKLQIKGKDFSRENEKYPDRSENQIVALIYFFPTENL